MPAITTELRVLRYNWKRRGREAYGYVEDQGSRQELVKTWRLWGVPVWRRVVDREEIPMHVLIILGCLGTTGGWKSKFSEHIQAAKGQRA